MTAYIIRRIMQAVIVLSIVTILLFLAMRLLPGDPILLYMSQSQMEARSPEQIALMRATYGLDKPMIVQYFDWASGLFRGDFGKSIFKGENVAVIIGRRLPVTIYLGSLAFLLSLFFGISSGVISAVRRGTKLDTIVTFFANLGITVPSFWLGILLVYFFGLYLHWLPIQGYTSPFDDFWLSMRKLIMPVFCLSVFAVAASARQTRSSMLEVISQDYIRTAWSKGLSERKIIISHALKNGLIPVITLKGMHIRDIVGGSVFIETVFNIPGMGKLAADGIFNHDYAVVQGVAVIIAAIVVLSNLLVDLSYGWLDPRVRYD